MTPKKPTDPLWEKVKRETRPLDKGDRLAADPPKVTSHNGGIKRIDRRSEISGGIRFADFGFGGPGEEAPQSKKGDLGQLDRRIRRSLGRGTRAIDDVIDLHGLSREKAYALLARRIPALNLAGKSLILVITGKGGARFQQSGDAKPVASRKREDFNLHEGVLRAALPGWLGSAALRPYVAAFNQASDLHGGAGAFYVRLKDTRKVKRGS